MNVRESESKPEESVTLTSQEKAAIWISGAVALSILLILFFIGLFAEVRAEFERSEEIPRGAQDLRLQVAALQLLCSGHLARYTA